MSTKIIGITGSVGSGKTTASSYISKKGIKVIDADSISKEMSESSEVIREICNVFGKGVIDQDGNIDRKKISDIVFSDEDKKSALEHIITKRVLERIVYMIEGIRRDDTDRNMSKLVFVDAPLLFETGLNELTDENWLIYVPDDVAIERTSKRDSVDRNKARAVLDSQMNISEKIKRADVVIDNTGSLEDLYKKLDRYI